MSKCLPILDQMPPEILEKIVGYTESMDKFRLRQCCKYLKKIVENLEIVLEELMVSYEWNWNRAHVYVKIPDNHHICKPFEDENSENQNKNAMLALKFVEKVLKCHPKIRVVKLKFFVEFKTRELEKHREIVTEEVSRVFSGLKDKLSVEIFEIESMSDEQHLMNVLPHLVPGALRELRFNNFFDKSIELPRTVETEQWKHIKLLSVPGIYLSIDLEKTDHIEIMEYRVARLEVEDVKRIVEDILSENGRKERVVGPDEYDFDAINQYLSQFGHKTVEMDDLDLRMTIRRDGYGCEIVFYRTECYFITFIRIDRVS